jgi:oxalate decarboxylase/phosphoglucose isomerase-like protein (cupin superfamily)
MFGAHGRFRTELLHAGDVGYIPQGYGHSIENVGSKPSRILIGFNTGIYEFCRLWYGEPNPISNAVGYAAHHSRSDNAVIRVYDAAGDVVETHEHKGDFKE